MHAVAFAIALEHPLQPRQGKPQDPARQPLSSGHEAEVVQQHQQQLGVHEDGRAARGAALGLHDMDAEVALDDLGRATQRLGIA